MKNGNLVDTVSQIKSNDIKLYFDYFAKLPNITVIDNKYIKNISKILHK